MKPLPLRERLLASLTRITSWVVCLYWPAFWGLILWQTPPGVCSPEHHAVSPLLTFVRACMGILNVLAAVGLALLLALTPTDSQANEDPAPPWHLPRFDGDTSPRDQPPAGPLEAAPVVDARGLFDAVLTCFPSPSWWRPEVALEARATQRQDSGNTLTTAESGTYAGIVARLPLYSAAELDRERERESARRALVAQTVGKLEKALADRLIHRRELALARAVEARSSRRVVAGIAETAEQLAALNKVAQLESQLIGDAADLTAARLLLVGMCKDRADVEAALDRLIGPAQGVARR